MPILRRTITTSYGKLMTEPTWIDGFFKSDKLKSEMETIAKTAMDSVTIQAKHKVNFSIDTSVRRGRYTSQIIWKQENVYFREMHYKYLTKISRARLTYSSSSS